MRARPATASLDRWWQRFGDPHLDDLVAEALNRNSDLALAALNVRSAQLQDAISRSSIQPSRPAIPMTIRKPLNGSFSRDPIPQPHGVGGVRDRSLGPAGGRPRMWRDGRARATVEDRRSAALTLIGTTINLYYQIAALNQRIDSSERSIAYAEKTLQLVQILKDAGGATKLEVAEAEQSLQSQRVSQADLVEQRVELRNALYTVLLGGTPWPEGSEASAVPDGPAANRRV